MEITLVTYRLSHALYINGKIAFQNGQNLSLGEIQRIFFSEDSIQLNKVTLKDFPPGPCFPDNFEDVEEYILDGF